MTAEFNWWLLLLGLVVGGGLTWLVLAETRRREQDLEEAELAEEAAWLEARMAEEGTPLPAETIERVVQLHRAYLSIAPPDEARDEEWPGEEPALDVAEPWQRRPESAAGETPDDDASPGRPTSPATPEEPVVRHEARGG